MNFKILNIISLSSVSRFKRANRGAVWSLYPLLQIILFASFCLKGHGNESDFLGFLQKLGPHRSLTLPFEPFRF